MSEPQTEPLYVSYTLFDSVWPKEGAVRTDVPWSDLVARIRDAREYPSKESCPLISMAEYGDKLSAKGYIRHSGNVNRIFGVEFDYDGEKIGLQEASATLRRANITGVLYTSASHTPDKPRWRILLPLSEPAIPDKRAEYVGRVNRIFGGVASNESFSLSQSFYIGRVKGKPYQFAEVNGRLIDMAADIEPLYPASHDELNRDTRTNDELREAFDRGEDRYVAMMKLSSRWAARGMEFDDICAALEDLLAKGNSVNHDGTDLRTRIVPLAESAVRKFGGRHTAERIAAVEPRPRKAPMQWATLASLTPPPRSWAIEHWLGMGHVTLLAGAGGLGKTSVAQALGSCISVGREYLDVVPVARNVLMWACEDDDDELWRRQIAIAQALGEPMPNFQNTFNLMSYDGEDVELCCLKDGVVAYSPMLEELTQQIGDYRAEVVILDNIARLYGCNENDRHQVTSFIAMLTKAARPTKAAILLLGHPAKGPQSEYSGSTAWEGAVRARLYLGRNLPDKEPAPDEAEDDDGTRYLCRRKANYTTRDYRRIKYCNGVMIPEDAERPVTARPSEYARDVVVRAVIKLEQMGKYGTASTASQDYLPKLASNYNLLEGVSTKQFVGAMRELEIQGKLATEVVGQYPNRTPKRGFRVKSS